MDPLASLLPSGPGQVVLGCTLEGVLGKGGMGIVYRARDPAGRPVAVKLILGLDATRRDRFTREAQALAHLRHPGIVHVYSAELSGMTPALVMELVEGGRGLDAIYNDASAPLDQKLDLLEQVCRAVEFAHQKGIVHRDLKPANVLVTLDGRAKVADFGLVLDLNRETRLTKTGAIVGTPNYLAPEQVNGSKQVTPRVDVWALGVMLFEALTLSRPFEGDSAIALLGQILAMEPPLPSTLAKNLTPDHDAVVARALAKDPADRYPSAGVLGDEIARLRSGSKVHAPPPARPARPMARALAAGGVVVCALGMGVALLLRADRDGTTTGADGPRRPTVVLRGGAAALTTTTPADRLVLTGMVDAAPGTEWVELASGEARTRVAPGPFHLEVPLQPGLNRVGLLATDPRGVTAAPLTVEATWDVPRWYVDLPAARRPAMPLPAGIRWLDAPNRYRAADGSELVWVPPATFTAGHRTAPHGEQPRQVTVAAGYFIGRTEVSWAQWTRWAETLDVKADAVAKGPRTSPERPVTGVPWAVAVQYCEAHGLRLANEDEWELAARGTDGRRWPWGDDEPPNPRRARGELSLVTDQIEVGSKGFPTVPVDTFPDGASPYGCLHMIGNASEWTSTPAPEPGTRVVRGASWTATPDDTACKRWHVPEVPRDSDDVNGPGASNESPRVGFRVAR